VLFVEDFNNRNDVDGIHSTSAGVGEDGDEDVLLDVERPRIERELPPRTAEHAAARQLRRHPLAERHDGNLSGDGGDRQRLCSVPEELVEERKYDAG